jgi:tRNA threonylcarbamoyladenosine biosynthesis protein TsaE
MTNLSLHLTNEAATDRLGAVLARILRAGDTVLLSGSIGAGKTHFSRALIRARLRRAEDVPSPTFTLVQSYDAQPEIWHADLYRLSSPDEVIELGLEAAFDTAICLVEWPDRLGDLTPPDALHLNLADDGQGRLATFTGGRVGLLQTIQTEWGRHD